ncbi:hypothetical protein [Winogradskyella pacifica]|uniref:hypothetical protein n=1 Tax=Winogradskyella pacifica TaxID=664642 RepID=UPI0015CE7166|nr:hypothetical protein [Winogradskyella pacifica]
MKKILIILLLLSNYCFAQFEKEYDITLKFDSSKNEMIKYGFEETNFKYFKLSKKEKKGYLYTFGIDQEGKLEKNIRSNSGECCSIEFQHNKKKNRIIKKLKINLKNTITYKDFKEAKFSSFLKVLGEARKVYIIDIAEQEAESIYYIVYEVSF